MANERFSADYSIGDVVKCVDDTGHDINTGDLYIAKEWRTVSERDYLQVEDVFGNKIAESYFPSRFQKAGN